MYARSSVRTKPSSVVVAAPCAGLAPTTHPTSRNARSSVPTKPSSVVVAAPCAGLAPTTHPIRRDARSNVRKQRTSIPYAVVAHVYNILITIRLSFACGRTKVRPYLSMI